MFNTNDKEKSIELADVCTILFHEMDDCSFIMDENGTIIQANKVTLNNLEYTSEEFSAINVLLLYPPQLRGEIVKILQGMVASTINKCSIPLYTKSGKLLAVETSIFKGKWQGKNVWLWMSKYILNKTPIYDEDGNVVDTTEITREITERKFLEVKLEQQKRFLKE